MQAPGESVDRERGAMERWRTLRPWLGLGAALVIGGIPFSNLAARLTRGVDLRDVGNGTVSEITRHLRTHLQSVLQEDYIRTARAKGASLWRHLYKDGLVMPLSSVLASKVPYVLGGAIVVEQVFNWPGMGRLTWQAASDRDYPVLLGVTLVSAVIVRVAHALKQAVQVAVNPQLAE